MVPCGSVLEAAHHHGNEVVDALHRHIQGDHHVGAEHSAPALNIFGIEKTAVARLQLPNRFELVSRPNVLSTHKAPLPHSGRTAEIYTVTDLVSDRSREALA
jgi:hypothetical protein